MGLYDRVLNALTILGTTENEIAERLLAEGCWGELRSPCSCPVANYLNKMVPGYDFEIRRNQVWCKSGPFLRLSDKYFNFIRKFDLRYYPQLVDRNI